MVQDKTLRLLVTNKCSRNCPKCCNKQFNLDKIPIVTSYSYREICITGGEPLLQQPKIQGSLRYLIYDIRQASPETKIFIYTAEPLGVYEILAIVDGITITLHDKRGLQEFLILNRDLLSLKSANLLPDISLILKIFKEITLPKNIDLSIWKIKDNLIWIDDCPLPEDEDFKRLENLF